MLFILLGLIIAAAGVTAFWYLLPRNGVVHPIATAPVLESVVPIGVVGACAIGVAMIGLGVTML